MATLLGLRDGVALLCELPPDLPSYKKMVYKTWIVSVHKDYKNKRGEVFVMHDPHMKRMSDAPSCLMDWLRKNNTRTDYAAAFMVDVVSGKKLRIWQSWESLAWCDVKDDRVYDLMDYVPQGIEAMAKLSEDNAAWLNRTPTDLLSPDH